MSMACYQSVQRRAEQQQHRVQELDALRMSFAESSKSPAWKTRRARRLRGGGALLNVNQTMRPHWQGSGSEKGPEHQLREALDKAVQELSPQGLGSPS